MNKREFLRLKEHEQREALEKAAHDVNCALNLYGRETVADLMEASWDADDADRYIRVITKTGPDFGRSFVRAAMPSCNRYLRYARYRRGE